MAESKVWRGLGKTKSPSTVILDDNKVKLSSKGTKRKQQDEDEEDEEERPGWLPDGWIMEVNRCDDGTIYRYYTSPLSGLTFTMKTEVLNYLFSGMDERFLESNNCATDKKLLMTHDWLPTNWIIEIRVGGDNMNKMYKFYFYPPAGVRLFSKEDVLLYINESKITRFDLNGECDTNTNDNILANVEFNPHSLPKGWVKELVFRKTKDAVRRDPYYTDPISNYSFRTKKSAMLYVQTGIVPKRAFIQRTSVHDLYSFEKSADLHESLKKRLLFTPTVYRQPRRSLKSKNSSLVEKILSDKESSYSSEDDDSYDDSSYSSNERAKIKVRPAMTTHKSKKMSSSTIKRPVGRAPKRSNEDDESYDDLYYSSDESEKVKVRPAETTHKRKKVLSSSTIKRPTGRPPKRSNERSSEDHDSYNDLYYSSDESEKIKVRPAKTTYKSKKLISLNTIKRPTGRPPKRSNEDDDSYDDSSYSSDESAKIKVRPAKTTYKRQKVISSNTIRRPVGRPKKIRRT